MNPWVFLTLVGAVVVFLLDKLFRRKKWKDNSKAEKISLLVNMFSVAPYIYLSALGMLWGIVPMTPETSFGKAIYDATLSMGGIYFIIAIAAVILSFVFRKIRKAKASIWTNIIALLYIAVVLAANVLAAKIF